MTHFRRAGNSDIPRRRSRRHRVRRSTSQSWVPRKARYGAWNALYVVRNSRIVKVGITSNLDQRLRQHRAQGLWKVVYVLHHPDPDAIAEVEYRWKRFVRANPRLRVGVEVLPDGYTEALRLNEDVQSFIDRLVRLTNPPGQQGG